MVKIGEMIRVIDHDIEGLRWTVGQVGFVKANSHVNDFDANYPGGARNIPIIKQKNWLLSLGHDEAKNGYAYVILSEDHFAPHACTSRCGIHKGLLS